MELSGLLVVVRWEESHRDVPVEWVAFTGCRNGGARGGPAETFNRARLTFLFPIAFPNFVPDICSTFRHTLIPAASFDLAAISHRQRGQKHHGDVFPLPQSVVSATGSGQFRKASPGP